ncbi:MAG: phage terminase large subunit [Brevundimonas sp.]
MSQRNQTPQAMTPQPGDWVPDPGPQTEFLSLGCFEALYGGQAGGGKTASLAVDALRYVGQGHGAAYQAVIFRRTYEDLKRTVLLETHTVYPRLGGRYNAQDHCWRFPAGELIWLGYCEHEFDVLHWQGTQLQFVGWDELTQFTESQYLYLFSRVRSVRGIPGRVRAATNPGGPGHDWVFKRWGPWLDPEHSVQANPGQVVYFAPRGDDEEGEDIVPRTHPDALGRCFVPAALSDNTHLRGDKQYGQRLNRLDPVTRAQLKDGNWLIKPGKGMLFKRGWFAIEDCIPQATRWIRYWDLAATEGGGDWTVGVLMAIAPDKTIWIVDVVRFQGSPGEVERRILETARQDGVKVPIGIPQDPGQAGKAQTVAFQKLLQGYTVRFLRETGDKVQRAGPLSAQAEPRGAEHGQVKLVSAPWNLPYLQELEGFPEWKNDDQVDASSGAFSMINGSNTLAPTAKPRQPEARFSVLGDDD